MPYQQYGTIQASTYNAFTAIVNSIYADTNAGATTFTNASYGYGQTPALSTTVPAGSLVTAAEWASLFSYIEKCGNHQGTPVVPPLPGVAPGYDTGSTTLPAAGNTIVAYNTPAGALTTLINTLITNRFNLYTGQTAIVDLATSLPQTWTHTLTGTFTANFGSWDSARHFFNAGGAIRITGYHPATYTGSGADDIEWNGMLTSMSPLVFNYNASTPFTGSPGPIGGFWNTGTGNPLTTSFQTIYTQTYSPVSPYTNSYIQVSAKLGAAAGTVGSEIITFQIYFDQVDTGTLFSTKIGTTITPGYRYSPGGTAVPTFAPLLSSVSFVAT